MAQMNLVRVHRDFSGRLTGEQWIRQGEYVETDPRLFNIVWYLIENGFASVIGVVESDYVPPEPVEAQEAPVLSDSDVIVMPSAEEPKADTAVYEHQGRKIKAGKPRS